VVITSTGLVVGLGARAFLLLFAKDLAISIGDSEVAVAGDADVVSHCFNSGG
jgi:hypothetical protein